MATITITETILDGDLGDGWRNNAETADALAEYTRATWEKDLESYAAQGHTVVINISVQYSTSGYSGPLTIDVDEEKISESEIERCLTPGNTIWEEFCKSEDARDLSIE